MRLIIEEWAFLKVFILKLDAATGKTVYFVVKVFKQLRKIDSHDYFLQLSLYFVLDRLS